MKYKTATRIAVRLIGLFLICSSIGSSSSLFGYLFQAIDDYFGRIPTRIFSRQFMYGHSYH